MATWVSLSLSLDCFFPLFAASECGFPGVPSNGSLVGSSMLFHPGEEASYLCHEGFVLFGDDKRTCSENGTWHGPIPNCRESMALNRPSAGTREGVGRSICVSKQRFDFRTKSGSGKPLSAVIDLMELRSRSGRGR